MLFHYSFLIHVFLTVQHFLVQNLLKCTNRNLSGIFVGYLDFFLVYQYFGYINIASCIFIKQKLNQEYSRSKATKLLLRSCRSVLFILSTLAGIKNVASLQQRKLEGLNLDSFDAWISMVLL